MANISDISRDQWMLRGPLAKRGYDWWWHNFTAEHEKTGKKKAFYVEFFTCNPGLAKDEPVFCWNAPEKQAAGERPSYLMVNVGFWGEEHGQLHRFFPWKAVEVTKGVPYRICADNCVCTEDYTAGRVTVTEEEKALHPEWMSDAGSMTWCLSMDKQVAFHVGYGAAAPFRALNAFEMFWHAEGMKTAFSGEVVLNGERYLVRPETCNGYADKNWGGDFTSPWVWLSSNRLTSLLTGEVLTGSVFDIGGGRPKVCGLALDRKLLGSFYYKGRDYEFNFSKFWTLSGTKFRCWEDEAYIYWHVIQTTVTAKLDTRVRCKKSEMLNIRYESPDGFMRHTKLWNGGTGKGILRLYVRRPFGPYRLVDKIRAEGIGCEFGEYPEG